MMNYGARAPPNIPIALINPFPNPLTAVGYISIAIILYTPIKNIKQKFKPQQIKRTNKLNQQKSAWIEKQNWIFTRIK